MPLIVITGIPSSGKTTRSHDLQQFFQSKSKEVVIVSENDQISSANFIKNSIYSDAGKEKHIRGLLKSEVLKHISSTNVVILDALNYIKGYRYELYCGSKANKSTQCTIHCEINRDVAWSFNEKREDDKYSREIFDALVMRYEDPDGKNRWDSPLFTVFPGQELDMEAVIATLFDKAPPPPNLSTQNAPLSATNFLYDLDQVTKKIVDGLIKSKNMGMTSSVLAEGLTVDVSNASVQKLMMLRRQYIIYSKMHPPDADKIPQLFVQYLSTSLQQ